MPTASPTGCVGLVTVIIDAGCDAALLARCLAGLTRQGMALEGIVVDRRGDPALEAEAQRHGARCVVVPGASPAQGRLAGARSAAGAVLLFIEGSMIPCPGWVRAIAEPLLRNEAEAAQGAFRTRQEAVVARWQQLVLEEHQERHVSSGRLLAVRDPCLGVRREVFLAGEYAGGETPAANDPFLRELGARGRCLYVSTAVVERRYPEAWRPLLTGELRTGLGLGRALRAAPRTLLSAAEGARARLLCAPLIAATPVLALSALAGAPTILLTLAAGIAAPLGAQAALLKRGWVEHGPKAFPALAGVAWLCVVAWSVGFLRGAWPHERLRRWTYFALRRLRGSRAESMTAAPHSDGRTPTGSVPVHDGATSTPLGAATSATGRRPAVMPTSPGASTLDPASVVQRRLGPTGVTAIGSHAPHVAQPEQERRVLDFTP